MSFIILFGAKYLIFIIIALFGLFWLQQNTAMKKEILLYILVISLGAYTIAKISSLLYYDPRPFVEGHFIPLIAHQADNGFPSDHTLLGAVLAAGVYTYKKYLGILLGFLTIFMGFCRVYAGVHHAIDITGSIAIAISVTYLSRQYILPSLKQYTSSTPSSRKAAKK